MPIDPTHGRRPATPPLSPPASPGRAGALQAPQNAEAPHPDHATHEALPRRTLSAPPAPLGLSESFKPRSQAAGMPTAAAPTGATPAPQAPLRAPSPHPSIVSTAPSEDIKPTAQATAPAPASVLSMLVPTLLGLWRAKRALYKPLIVACMVGTAALTIGSIIASGGLALPIIGVILPFAASLALLPYLLRR